LNDPCKIKEMGRRGREKVEKLYNVELHYQRIMNIYQKLITNNTSLSIQ